MGTGGHRTRAGRRGWHARAEHCQRIDVRSRTADGTLKWADGGTCFYVRVDECVEQRINVVRTPCNFGGARSWFQCPCCGERVAVLYVRGPRGYACRKCNQIAFASQSLSPLGRNWRRQAKLEARLGEDRERPPGMHQSTYERLLNELAECEATRYAMAAVFLERWVATISSQLP